MMMEASMGEVRLRPVMKSPWLKTTPHKAPMKKKRCSCQVTLSRVIKREATQKAAVPKRIRERVRPSGEIQTGNRDLESGILIPNIKVTANMMRCPAFLSPGM
jgi:hypothetical protein